MKTKPNVEPPQPEPMLLPKGQTGPSLTDRKKHPRLLGADLYVARLGWCGSRSGGLQSLPTLPVSVRAEAVPSTAEEPAEDLTASGESLPSTASSSTSGSLHDELLNRTPSPRRAATMQETLDPDIIRASRPCYRCISYMHSVGIKRVFWTNDAGEWEGGKVRDLVDALDSSMESVAKGTGGDGGPMGNGVFVTKHEVLLLKRTMGGG